MKVEVETADSKYEEKNPRYENGNTPLHNEPIDFKILLEYDWRRKYRNVSLKMLTTHVQAHKTWKLKQLTSKYEEKIQEMKMAQTKFTMQPIGSFF